MNVDLTCECGNEVTVSEGQAGAKLPCECGRILNVPSLAELRMQIGLPAVKLNAAEMIEQMHARGELSADDTCVHCRASTDDVLDILADCERPYFERIPGFELRIFGLLVDRSEGRETLHGRSRIVHAPIPICGACRENLQIAPPVFPLRFAMWSLLVAGVTVLPINIVWGINAICSAILFWLLRVYMLRRTQRVLRSLLCVVPVYEQLLEEYPDVYLSVDAG